MMSGFLDEAHFLLNGHVNPKNWVFWGSKNPHRIVGRPLHSKKCTAWVAISKHDIIGPFFFKDDHGIAVTVTKERYVPVLEQFWGELDKHEDLDEKESGSSMMVPLLTLLMLPWLGSMKSLGSVS